MLLTQNVPGTERTSDMRNRGIAIELTALLDVILIMLFWVMLNMENETDRVKTEAAEAVAEQQERFDRASAELESELDAVKEQYERFLDENADDIAVANQKALDEFAEGRMFTLNLSYDAVGKLFILDENGEIAHTMLNSEQEIADSISKVREESGLDKDDVILCAFVYDGSRALYRDVNMVSAAAGEVGKDYERFYCTYINISR